MSLKDEDINAKSLLGAMLDRVVDARPGYSYTARPYYGIRGMFWFVGDVADEIWGPPLVSNPTGQAQLKMEATSVVRCAIRRVLDIGREERFPDLQGDEAREAIKGARGLLEKGTFDFSGTTYCWEWVPK